MTKPPLDPDLVKQVLKAHLDIRKREDNGLNMKQLSLHLGILGAIALIIFYMIKAESREENLPIKQAALENRMNIISNSRVLKLQSARMDEFSDIQKTTNSLLLKLIMETKNKK